MSTLRAVLEIGIGLAAEELAPPRVIPSRQLMTRREILRRLGYGAAGAWALPLGSPLAAAPSPAPALELDDLEGLAERIRTTPRGAVLGLAAGARRAGADTATLLGAVFLAGARDIRPWHVGGKLHAVMMVESTFQLAAGMEERDAWLAALWNLDDFKRSQIRDIEDSGGDWVLPPRPQTAAVSEAAARRELSAAMEAWDPERADRAIVALLPYHGRHSLFEILWPLAARSFVNIGHKIIYAAQIERTLRRLEWKHAEPALRSLVMALLFQPSGRMTGAVARSRELAARLPEGWLAGAESPERSLDLLRVLRRADRNGAQDLVVSAFSEGLGPQTVWDALRLRSAEVFSHRASSTPRRREALLPVHAVTVTNAFGHAWRTSRDDRTRRLMVLQSAAWLADLHAWLEDNDCIADATPPLEKLGADAGEAPATLEALLEEPSAARARAFLDRRPAQAGSLVARLQRHLIHTAVEHHQHKYAAAFAEEASLADPRWRPLLLAPALPYMPAGAEPATDFTRRALAALA